MSTTTPVRTQATPTQPCTAFLGCRVISLARGNRRARRLGLAHRLVLLSLSRLSHASAAGTLRAFAPLPLLVSCARGRMYIAAGVILSATSSACVALIFSPSPLKPISPPPTPSPPTPAHLNRTGACFRRPPPSSAASAICPRVRSCARAATTASAPQGLPPEAFPVSTTRARPWKLLLPPPPPRPAAPPTP